ncbi:MAG: CaiB/BaiF CoA transferase family protein [Egibacteraceae bacterium]|jgi:crotonobetainyl-CoA:carnitine CoA-transferase CaiB-like acyl-CoA transferase
MTDTAGALDGVRVLDIATMGAGPWIGTRLADFGAEVIKVEHPTRPDPFRGLSPQRDGVALWWKSDWRNHRAMTLDLKNDAGRDLALRLAAEADVLIENFRPGTLEAWGLGWEVLRRVNQRLVMVRATGWGQTGPYARRPGFGTLAEAASGLAHLNGWPDDPPTLPPLALGDQITSVLGAYATMVALYERDRPGGSGQGQVIDLAISEAVYSLLGLQTIVHDQLGETLVRTGNVWGRAAPRNIYRCGDGQWIAIAASTPSIFANIMRAIGRPELLDDPRFHDPEARAAHRAELDEIMAAWLSVRTRDEALEVLMSEGGVAPVHDAASLAKDPHNVARELITTVDDPELGDVQVANVRPILGRTPGRVRHLGRPHGADTEEILAGLGLSDEEVAVLREQGTV